MKLTLSAYLYADAALVHFTYVLISHYEIGTLSPFYK